MVRPRRRHFEAFLVAAVAAAAAAACGGGARQSRPGAAASLTALRVLILDAVECDDGTPAERRYAVALDGAAVREVTVTCVEDQPQVLQVPMFRVPAGVHVISIVEQGAGEVAARRFAFPRVVGHDGRVADHLAIGIWVDHAEIDDLKPGEALSI